MINEQVKALNESIKNGNNTINTYAIAEALKVDSNTILTEVDTGNMVSIDDAYNAVIWHKLINGSITPYAGRGNVNQQEVTHRVKLLCYSKKLDFYGFICSKIAGNNEMQLTRLDFSKERLLKAELPEILRNFNNEHYFFAVEYEIKSIIDSKCYTNFCF